MWKMFKRSESGQFEFSPVVIAILGVMVIAILVPILTTIITGISTGSAIDTLEGKGYKVLASSEYNALTATLADIQAKALVAATAAQITLDKLELFNENEANLFPNSAIVNITLTAGAPADNFGVWTEVVDSSATTFSSKFAANSGYIRELTLYGYSKTEEIYIIELGYGPNNTSPTIIGRTLVRSDWTYIITLYGPEVPSGQKIYYRMKAQTASAYMRVNFKYYYSD